MGLQARVEHLNRTCNARSASTAHPCRVRPILVINPRSDGAFVAFVEACIERGPASVQDLEREIRGRYPHALVRERTLSGEPLLMWYVYREGAWVPSESD